jgi:pimeloyl-ACP methyl ester carboxylesterase
MLYHKIHLHPDSSEWTVFIHGFGGSSNVWNKQVRDFEQHFNVLLIDLRSHGKSTNFPQHKRYSFELIAKEVGEVIDHVKIKRAHFLGVSMGSIIIRQLAILKPTVVQSMIFAGAVTTLDFKSRFFLKLGRTLQPILPYMALYRLFANIMMPKKNHEVSRSIFIQEAKKITKKEFTRWFKLTGKLTKYLSYLHHENTNEKALYIMGSEDHLFIGPAKKVVENNPNLSIEIVEACGHLVNIEKSEVFNKLAIDFIHKNQG